MDESLLRGEGIVKQPEMPHSSRRGGPHMLDADMPSPVALWKERVPDRGPDGHSDELVLARHEVSVAVEKLAIAEQLAYEVRGRHEEELRDLAEERGRRDEDVRRLTAEIEATEAEARLWQERFERLRMRRSVRLALALARPLKPLFHLRSRE